MPMRPTRAGRLMTPLRRIGAACFGGFADFGDIASAFAEFSGSGRGVVSVGVHLFDLTPRFMVR
jgi:hypothetical protein